MNVSTIDDGDTTDTTTDDNTFYSSDNDPRRVYWDLSADETFESNEHRRVYPIGSPPSTPPPPPRRKRRLSIGMSFPKKGGSVAAHLRGMRPTTSTDKDNLTPNGKLKTLNTTNQTHNQLFFKLF